jgi:hypothetical protein
MNNRFDRRLMLLAPNHSRYSTSLTLVIFNAEGYNVDTISSRTLNWLNVETENVLRLVSTTNVEGRMALVTRDTSTFRILAQLTDLFPT